MAGVSSLQTPSNRKARDEEQEARLALLLSQPSKRVVVNARKPNSLPHCPRCGSTMCFEEDDLLGDPRLVCYSGHSLEVTKIGCFIIIPAARFERIGQPLS